ncbi:MAG: hypothetical protein O2930_04785 [Acidobacteria bacterium]|nr:hypothetical protein [Acidobacteriota bacterium]
MTAGAGSRGRTVLIAVLAACAVAANCSRGGVFGNEYEYEEELYLSLDGSATVNVHASIASLAALRGAEFDPDPVARIDLNEVRSWFGGETTEASVSFARRDGRRFVHAQIRVADVRELPRLAPFTWSAYRFERRDGMFEFTQVVGPPAGSPGPAIQWTGEERVLFRMHLPSEILLHNAPSRQVERGNILEWEQSLADRLAGQPVDVEVHLEPESILYTTLLLFASTVVAAAAAIALVIWWIARRGRDDDLTEDAAPASGTG